MEMTDFSNLGGRACPPKGVRLNTLNLRGRALEALFDLLDADERPRSDRRFVRWQFRRESIEIKLIQTGGTTVFRVATRDLSRGGMSVLHNHFIHPQTRCEVLLPLPGGGVATAKGWVIRCTHRDGVVHEAGIRFDSPMDAREIADIDPMDNVFSFAQPPLDQLSGTCLYFGDVAGDGERLRSLLGGTGFKLAAFGEITPGLTLLTGVDLVILAADLPGIPPRVGVGLIRDTGFAGPIALIAPDRLPRTRLAVLAAPAAVIIVKPLERTTLLLGLAEALLVRREGSKAA